MDAWQARQPETRLVRWPWVGKEQLVTLPHWHWWYFDQLCARYAMRAEDLHRRISERYPIERAPNISSSIFSFLTVRSAEDKQRRDRLANDNHWHNSPRIGRPSLSVEEVASNRSGRPVRYTFPVIQSSPFQPMARPKRLFAEAEIRDR